MRTRLLPVLTLALASTVGCSQAPPTVSTQPLAPDAQRQIANEENEQQADDSQMAEPMSVQALPQKLNPNQVVELPADKLKDLPTPAMDSNDRSIQQRRGFRSFGGSGWRGYSRFGRNLRFYSYGSYYYPYFLSGSFYYPYAYYPYTYAYYPTTYYNYAYTPYYLPYYTYGSYYYPYAFSYSRYSRRWGGTGRRGGGTGRRGGGRRG